MTNETDDDMVEDRDLIGLGEDCFWWEKTVEFLFARTMFAGATISPLSGTMEQYAGDVFLRSADEFGIIEFKASQGAANSESKKFIPQSPPAELYLDYLNLIQKKYENPYIGGREPHLMIYGVEVDEGIAIKRADC